MKPKVKVLADMTIEYPDTFENLTLTQFSCLIHAFKATNHEYRRSTAAYSYKMLGIGHLYEKFVKEVFEKLQ